MSLFEALFCVTTMTDNLIIKRNDFQSDTTASFRLFRYEDYLQDVTLVSDDQTQVQAHKLVLSASSDYFKDIFMKNKHQHPLLCLQGVSGHDLNNILDYIYHGEIIIPQDNVDAFMIVAKRLMLIGLVPDQEKNVPQIVETKKEGNHEELDEILPSADGMDMERESETGILNIKNEEELGSITKESKLKSKRIQKPQHLKEIDKQLMDLIEKSPHGTFSCSMCGQKDKVMPRLLKHIETHMAGLSFQCSDCEKSYSTRASLANHKSLYHRKVKFSSLYSD